MPPRSNPTVRQARLGTELRRMRESAGVSAREAASLLSASPTQISHIESGRFGISEQRLRRLAAFYSCPDGALIDALAEVAREHQGGGWWEVYRGVLPAPLLDLSELEHHATGLRALQITHVPGALQTEEYARTVFGNTLPGLPETDLEARVEHRMERGRRILFGESPPSYTALVHEAALRMRFGGRRVAREQLERLAELSSLQNVTLQVVPFTSEAHIGSGHAMLYLSGPLEKLDTVQVEAVHSAMFLDAESHLRNYRDTFRVVAEEALTPAESLELLHNIAHDV